MSDSPYRLVIHNDVFVEFSTVGDAMSYLSKHFERSRMLFDSLNALASATTSVYKQALNGLNRISASTHISQSGQAVALIQSIPVQTLPGHPVWEYVDHLGEHPIPTQAAAHAFLLNVDLSNHAGLPQVFHGFFLGLAYQLGLSSATAAFSGVIQEKLSMASALLSSIRWDHDSAMNDLTRISASSRRSRRSLARLLVRTRSVVTKEVSRAEDHLEACSARMSELRHRHLSHSRRLIRFVRDAQERFAASRKEEIETRLIDFESAMSQGIATKAAREYWDQRAADHTKRAGEFKTFLVRAIQCTGGGLAVALVSFGVLAAFGVRLSEHLEFAALGAVTLVLAFWILRLFARQYFSHLHLARDAKERSVMIDTYIALIKGGQTTPSDDALKYILQPLFRPGTDGYIKGDHGPNHPLFEVVQNLKSRQGDRG